jgi:uncharacterized membrane protein YbhN (UPF0104 family)
MTPIKRSGFSRSAVIAANWLFIAGAVGFGLRALSDNRGSLSSALADIGWTAVVLSGLAATLGVVLSSQVWRSALRAVGADPAWPATFGVFFPTQIGKYLPGAVWPYAAQLRFASRMGLSKARMTVAQAAFLATHIATGVALGALALPVLILDGRVAAATAWLLIPAAAAMVLLHPRVMIGLLSRLLRRPTDPIDVDGGLIVQAVFWMLATWGCYGVSTALLVAPIATDWASAVSISIGAFAFAWVIGLFVIFAPAGVGAREAALVAALGAVVTRPEAVGVAVVSRALLTSADLLLAIAALMIIKRVHHPNESAEPSLDTAIAGRDITHVG